MRASSSVGQLGMADLVVLKRFETTGSASDVESFKIYSPRLTVGLNVVGQLGDLAEKSLTLDPGSCFFGVHGLILPARAGEDHGYASATNCRSTYGRMPP